MDQQFICGVDFDGTIVRHAFPRIGAPVPGEGWERMRKQPHEGLTRDYVLGPDAPKVELPTPTLIQS